MKSTIQYCNPSSGHRYTDNGLCPICCLPSFDRAQILAKKEATINDEKDFKIFEAGFHSGAENMKIMVTASLFPSAPEIKTKLQLWEEYKASQPVEVPPQITILNRLRALLTEDERKLCQGWTFTMAKKEE